MVINYDSNFIARSETIRLYNHFISYNFMNNEFLYRITKTKYAWAINLRILQSDSFEFIK